MPRRKDPLQPRKLPRQKRAQYTMDVIVETVAHMLTERPLEDFTTNDVAERAGVSIGSLYQYFPNKGALLARLWERHAGQILSRFQATLQSTASLPLPQRIEACLDWLIDTKREGVELERALYLHLHRYGDPLAVAELDVPILRALAQGIDATVGGTRTDFAAFVLLQAVRGVVLAGVFFHPESIADGSLRRELSALVRGYLAARTGLAAG